MDKYVYLIQSVESGKYKIGVSQQPTKRVKQLQTGSGEKLKLVETFKSPYYNKIEANLHNRYSYLKASGEWFDLTLKEEVSFRKDCQRIENNIKLLTENDNPFLK